MMADIKQKLYLFLATGCWAGFAPAIRGTAGTVVAVLIFLLIGSHVWVHLFVLAFLLLVSLPLGDWAERYWQKKDPQHFVLDEIVGYLIGVLLIPAWDTWVTALAGFVVFRLFDGGKPYPIRRLERVRGGAGIVLDDVIAGVYTNLALRVAVWASQLLLAG